MRFLYGSHLEALAGHLGVLSKTYKYMVLAERHQKTHEGRHLMVHEPAERILWRNHIRDAGFELATDARIEKGDPMQASDVLALCNDDDYITVWNEAFRYIRHHRKLERVRFHQYDEPIITWRETEKAARAALDCEIFLSDIFLVEPFKKMLGEEAISREQALIKLCELLNYKEDRQAYADELLRSPYQNPATLEHFDALLKGGLSRLLCTEFDELYRQYAHFRNHGGCNKVAAGNMVNATRWKSYMNIGLAHAIYSDEPNDVPSQIKAQDPKAQVGVLLLSSRRARMDLAQTIRRVSPGRFIRRDLMVWELEDRRPYPFREWMTMALGHSNWMAQPAPLTPR